VVCYGLFEQSARLLVVLISMNLLIGIVIAGLPLISIELLARIKTINPEVTRKLIHTLSALDVMLLSYWLSLDLIAVIAFIFFLIMLAGRRFSIWKSLNKISRNSWGEVAFTIGVGVTCLIASDESVFRQAIIILGLADTTAAIIGIHTGKHKVVFTQKTIEGSLAFVLTTIIIMLFFMQSLALSVTVGFVLTLTELYTPRGFDNITIPVAAVLLFG
jgi:phytol kinase